MFSDEILRAPSCTVPESSPAYNGLVEFVEKNYSDQTKDTRAIILALAYTRISHLKKSELSENYNINPSTSFDLEENKRLIKRVIKGLCKEEIYSRYCEEAKKTLEAVRQGLFHATLLRVDENFNSLNAKIDQDFSLIKSKIDSSSLEGRNYIDLKTQIFMKKKSSKGDILYNFFREIAIETIKYPIILIFSIIIIITFGYILRYTAPIMLDAFLEAVDKLIVPLRHG